MVLGCEFPLKLTHWCQIPPVLRSTPCAFWASIWTVLLLGASLGGRISRFLDLPAVLFFSHWGSLKSSDDLKSSNVATACCFRSHLQSIPLVWRFCTPRCPILLGCIVDCIGVWVVSNTTWPVFFHSSSYQQLLLALPLLIWHLLWVMSISPHCFGKPQCHKPIYLRSSWLLSGNSAQLWKLVRL